MEEYRAFSVVGGGPHDFSHMLNEEVKRGWMVINAGLSGDTWFAVLKRSSKLFGR